MSSVWLVKWQSLRSGLYVSILGRASLQSGSYCNLRVWQIEGGMIESRVGIQTNYPHNRVQPLCKHLRYLSKHTNVALFSTSSQFQTLKSSYEVGSLTKSSKSTVINLSASDIEAIFGNSLNRQQGNQLLRVLQDQRISGTLDEDVDASPVNIVKALAWLRIAIRVDEDQAILARLEREDIEEAAEIEKIRSYKPNQNSQEHRIYGKSVFQEIRELKEIKAAQEKARTHHQNENILQVQGISSKALEERRAKSIERVQKYRNAAERKGIDITKSRFERLWPSVLFVMGAVGLSAIFAHLYIPPSRKARILTHTPPAAATVVTLIGMNFLIFCAWRFPPAWKLMNRYFIITPAQPISLSLIGNFFSHQKVGHLAINMVILWFVGTNR